MLARTVKADALPVTRVEPPRGIFDLGLREVIRYRQLAYFLAWRDVKVRYKQTVFGGAWAVLQPLLMMVVFSVVFGRVAKVPSDGLPYPLFSYAALVPWTLFSQSVQGASMSLVNSQALVTKIYVPRLVIPIAAVGSTLLDFLVALSITAGLMVYYDVYPGWDVLWVVPLTALAIVTALAVGLWLSAISATYRDVRYVMPFFIQLWLFVTPVVYPSSLVEGPLRWALALNPMSGVVEGFRWALLGTGNAPSELLVVSAAVTVVGVFTGLMYFKWSEPRFVDVI